MIRIVGSRALIELHDARMRVNALIHERGGEPPPSNLYLGDAIEKRLVRLLEDTSE